MISGRLYFPGAIIPGVGALVGPGLASRNALWASIRKSFTCAGSACLRTNAACHALFSDCARARSGPQAALTASRWNASTSMLARSENGWHFATSSGW